MLAKTKDGKIIHVKDALVKTDYYCDNCGSILRVRNGKIRVKHFYHLNKDCGSKGESLIHKYWKNYFLSLKEFDGHNIIISEVEVPLLKGTYIPDIFIKTDKGTYIIIEIYYKNPKTDAYIEKFEKLAKKGVEKIYEIEVDFDKIISIKILFDTKDIKKFKEKQKELFNELERKRQYLINKYSKSGGLVYNIINDMLSPYILYKNLKNKYSYNHFTKLQYDISLSLKYKNFKIYLAENLNFKTEDTLIKSNPFYINIYDYKNFINYMNIHNNLIKFYSKDENLKGDIYIILADKENKY